MSARPFCVDWLPAMVPGNIQADLESARLLKPLWYGAGDSRLFDVARTDWIYRKEFTMPGSFSGRRIRLCFDGVDYACEVWLNGARIGGNPNMYRQFAFDVSDHVRIGERNRLDVRIQRMPEVLVPYLEKSDGKLSGQNTPWWLVDGMTKTNEVLKDLKSPTNFGYDWGVNIWTLGIWKDVRLEASGPALIENMKVETPLSSDYSRATVKVAAVVDSLVAGPAKLRMKVSGHGPDRVTEQSVTLVPGANRLQAQLELQEPALWWPNGHGRQPLYMLEATVVDASGKVSDARRTRFGVREVRWELTSEAPADFPQKYMPVINGRRIRMIGSNLIPPDLLFARIPERAPHLLRTARALGFTTLRVWGGGVILTPEIYDLADELGLMLMLEIPIANIDPKANPELLKNLSLTLPNIIRQVWNHPSIIEYTGGNEMRYGKVHKDLSVIEHIQGIFAEVDPSRVFRETDPTTGGTHGPWHAALKLENKIDPLQQYTTWNFLLPQVPDASGRIPTGPTSRISQSMRCGEFGYQTTGHVEVWHRDIPPGSQWPIDNEDPVLIRKNATYAVFDDDNWLMKPVIDFLFGDSPDLGRLLKAGQYVGGEGLRYAMDAIRRRGTATGGMMNWDFNEPWTNGAGSYVVDYDGRPLMNSAFLKQAVDQLSLSLRHTSPLYDIREGIQTALYLTSDSDQPVKDLAWAWRVRDRRGAVVSSGAGAVAINPIEVKKLADIAVTLPEKTAFGPFFLELQLNDSHGRRLHERVHVFGLRGVRAPLQGLLDRSLLDQDDDPAALQAVFATDNKAMPAVSRPVRQTSLQVSSTVFGVEGGEEWLELTLSNTGKMTALFCDPRPVLNYRTDLIIDNLFVSIPPGETRMLKIHAPLRPREGLSLAQTGWRIESWNAGPLSIEPSTDVVLALGRADRMTREYAGYPGPTPPVKASVVSLTGRQPDPGNVPCLMEEGRVVEFTFDSGSDSVRQGALLRIHSADQSGIGAQVQVELNGRSFELQLPEGYGIQKESPAHLARAQTTILALPVGLLKPANNVLRIRTVNAGWFTWDALDLRMGKGVE